ncbi:hypothetical protein T492DRAFT_1110982 [Pavlovales sp. CCMP2436]|nr:hypothetical protein T492DRAFT_1110982 [Pavlovales sp. CCMP2436]
MGHFPCTKQMSGGSLTPSASLATGSLLWMLPIPPGLQTNAQRSTWLYKAQADLAASETQGSVLMPSGEVRLFSLPAHTRTRSGQSIPDPAHPQLLASTGDNFPQSHPLRVRLHPRGQERVRPSDPGVTQQHRLVPMVHTPFVALLRPDHYAPARGVMRAVLRRELQIRACSPQSRRLRARSRGPQASGGDCPRERRPQGRPVPDAQVTECGPHRRPLGLRLKPQVQEGTQVTAYSKQKKTK